jgi:hypothetical protein
LCKRSEKFCMNAAANEVVETRMYKERRVELSLNDLRSQPPRHLKFVSLLGTDPFKTVDMNAIKPILTATLVVGQVDIGWTKQGMDGIEIWVDRGAGFAFLAVDTVPGYTDTQAMPAAGQSAL